MGLEHIVGLAQLSGSEVAGGQQMECLVAADLVEQPLGQEGGVPVRVVVQAVPDGSLKQGRGCHFEFVADSDIVKVEHHLVDYMKKGKATFS